jgi:hypothetical protein
MDLSAIEHEYALGCSPQQAFATFTERIGEWWPADYSPDPGALKDTVIEPGVGGRVFFVVDGLGEVPWGAVTTWDPGHRVAFTSTLAQSRQYPSEVDAVFEAAGEGCEMRLRHGGWNEGNAADRRKFSDWRLILDRFASLCPPLAEEAA